MPTGDPKTLLRSVCSSSHESPHKVTPAELLRFAEALGPHEFNTAREVRTSLQQVNSMFRQFLDSDEFTEKFKDEERVLLQDVFCADWTIDINVPVDKIEQNQMKSTILTDLPGKTEGGIRGQFLQTMIAASCKRASAALLLLNRDQVEELDGRDYDPIQRFLGGASNCVSYFWATEVLDMEILKQVSPVFIQQAEKLEQPVSVRCINSYLLRAREPSPVPQEFPQEDDEQRRRIILRGVEVRRMEPKDENNFDGKILQKDFCDKVEEFPDAAEFTKMLSISAAFNFPQVFLDPTLARTQEHLLKIIASMQDQLVACQLEAEKRDAEILACTEALGNLEANVKLYVQNVRNRTLEALKMRTNEIEETLGKGEELNPLNFQRMLAVFGAEVADVYARNVNRNDDGSVKWKREIFEAVRKCWVKEVIKVLDEVARAEGQIVFASTPISVSSPVDTAISRWYDFEKRRVSCFIEDNRGVGALPAARGILGGFVFSAIAIAAVGGVATLYTCGG